MKIFPKLAPVVGPLLFIVVSVFSMAHVHGQQLRMVGTPGALLVAGRQESEIPTLSVLGQAAIGVSEMGQQTAYVGIDYIRMFAQAASVFIVELPDTTVVVGKSIRLPIVIRRGPTEGAGSTINNVTIRFSYRCELVDLYGVAEQESPDGGCVASVTYVPTSRDVDTIWLEGISKLCSITSTPLDGANSFGMAERGRVEVVVLPGEIRQEGHCFTGATRRLLYSTVGISAFPQPAYNRVKLVLESLTAHEGVLSLTDITGNQLVQLPVTSRADGKAEIEIDMQHVVAGSYVVNYLHNGGATGITIMVGK